MGIVSASLVTCYVAVKSVQYTMSKASRHVSVAGLGDVKVAASDAKTFDSALQLLVDDVYLHRDSTAPGLVSENVLVAIVNDRVVGAIAVQAAQGRIGWIWPPVIGRVDGHANACTQIGRELVAAAVAELAEADCRLAQALLLPAEPRARDLEANSFLRITEMIRMERDCSTRPDSPHDAGELEFVAFGPATERAFEEVIEQTYAGSQDCPELDGVRTVSEALDSYKATGLFEPELWQLARHGDRWVGCVLLSYSPNESRCELQYMGVVPQARGRQLGRVLCARALFDARRVGARKLSLSVDSRNYRAINQYNSLGFVEIDRRAVYILNLKPTGTVSRA